MMLGYFVGLAFCLMFFIGWIAAHDTVATECKMLGSFYVGDTVYECKPQQKGNT